MKLISLTILQKHYMNEAVEKSYEHKIEIAPYGSLSVIKRFLKDDFKVLDIGCSSGYLGRACPECKFYGIDGNIQSVNEAKNLYVDAKCADLNNISELPVFDIQFDAIVYADVLEHVLYPDQVINHFKKYLKHGGLIIVSLPNIAIWRSRLNLMLGNFDYTDYGVMDRTHVHLYTFKTASELLRSCNLTVLHQIGAAYFLGPLVGLNSLFRNLFSTQIVIIATNDKSNSGLE